MSASGLAEMVGAARHIRLRDHAGIVPRDERESSPNRAHSTPIVCVNVVVAAHRFVHGVVRRRALRPTRRRGYRRRAQPGAQR
jgi:hypothetical protein